MENKLEKIKKVSTVNATAEYLKKQIEAGRLKPGEQLPSERTLQEELGVSRFTLREALARDDVERAKEEERVLTKNEARQKASAFIQNIHHFRDDNLISDAAPVEKVVVFDEAQRAWSRDQASRFMREKRGAVEFDMSEPEFLLSVMDRHDDWCCVICLIGGGQEINTGEAGLAEDAGRHRGAVAAGAEHDGWAGRSPARQLCSSGPARAGRAPQTAATTVHVKRPVLGVGRASSAPGVGVLEDHGPRHRPGQHR